MEKKAVVIVDCMGGDSSPDSIVKGAVSGAVKYETDLILTGNEKEINAALGGIDVGNVQIRVVNCESVVEMTDSPSAVQKEKKDSSMVKSCFLLHDGEGDAMISTGNTGALFTAATLYVRRIKGIRRASLCSIINVGHPFLLLDSGANIDVTPEILLQFAHMGSLYCANVLGMQSPRVALLNNGTEASKGTEIYKAAYGLLKESGLNFVGNIEGRDLVKSSFDVVVCDGFTGNIALKTIEGMGQFFLHSLKDIFTSGIKTKLSYLMVKNKFNSFKKNIDHKQYGGAPFIGILKPVIKVHGASEGKNIETAIKQARDYVMSGLNDKIAAGINVPEGKNNE